MSAFVRCSVAVLCMLPGAALATTVRPIPLAQMARESAVIVVARVGEPKTTWEDSKRIITLTPLTVLTAVKGAKAGEVLTVYQVGGTIGARTLSIPGALTLRPGETMVFFAARFGDRLVSYGMGLGKYRVHEEGGVQMVTPEYGDVAFVNPSGETFKPAAPPDTTTRPLAVFLDEVLSALAGGR